MRYYGGKESVGTGEHVLSGGTTHCSPGACRNGKIGRMSREPADKRCKLLKMRLAVVHPRHEHCFGEQGAPEVTGKIPEALEHGLQG
jgi:hypothetical protein